LAKGQPVQRYAGHTAAVERPLLRDANGGRVRLQHLARPGCDPLAGGHHLRRLGLVRLLERDASGKVWSATYQPTDTEPEACDVTFNEDRAEFTRRDGALATNMEVLFPPKTMRKCAA